MGLELLFMLLPVAALSGWVLGRRRGTSADHGEGPFFSRDYFRGLNYLLNEQPDKAIDVFVRILEVDSETVDTHFALGSLFRRRGEVDRAIRIHQNLIARPSLNRPQRNQALYELGRDYMVAGLFDRAESLFEELIDDRLMGQQALQQLLEIYQREKEWEKCIGVAQRLQPLIEKPIGPTVAHFHCELAEAAAQAGHVSDGLKRVKRALSEDPNCVRASLLEARFELLRGNPKTAMRVLKRVEVQDHQLLSEIIEPLKEYARVTGRTGEMEQYLRHLLEEHSCVSLALALTDQIHEREGNSEAASLIASYLNQRPSVWGMERLIDLKLGRSTGDAREDLTLLQELLGKLLESKPKYQCVQCGFTGKTMHWQCPGCKQWNTVKPIHGIEGE